MASVHPHLEHVPFGGKVFVFGGDFRQVLPVVVRGDAGKVLDACFKSSHLWRNIIVQRLTINMRVQQAVGKVFQPHSLSVPAYAGPFSAGGPALLKPNDLPNNAAISLVGCSPELSPFCQGLMHNAMDNLPKLAYADLP